MILSGKYGLIAPETPILYYDKKLLDHEVEGKVPQIVNQLKDNRIDRVTFFCKDIDEYPEWQPYLLLMKKGCRVTDTNLQVKEI